MTFARHASSRRTPGTAVATVVSLALLAGCLGGPKLKVPVKEMERRVKTLCTAPLELEFQLDGSGERIHGYQAILLQELHRTSWEIVAPERYAAVSRRVSAEEGGFYDPITGEADEARRARTAKRIREAVRSELGCEATLHPSIVVVGAPWSEGNVNWDGTTQGLSIVWKLDEPVPALSLWVSIRDELDQELFFGTGGIHILIGTSPAGFMNRYVFRISEEKLLTDVRRTYDSVRAALGPFLKEGPSVGVERYARKLGAAKSVAEQPGENRPRSTPGTRS
jgi:hypothetical protein